MLRHVPLTILLGALFLSGLASIINQVIWQRALKLYLGGSETLSSLAVVLVFVLGLGIGALLLGAMAPRLKSPIRTFFLIEFLLCGINLGIAVLLSSDLGDNVYLFQRLAISAGVPLRLLYLLSALVILLPPCALMGMTIPLSSEISQRQFGYQSTNLIAILFFLNTFGAVLGAVSSGLYFLPYFGQRFGLIIAATCNLLAGLLLLVLVHRMGLKLSAAQADGSAGETPSESRAKGIGSLTVEDFTGFFMGLLSLGYEMYLIRHSALLHEPLPTVFAKTLCCFLFFWSCGMFAASFLRERLGLWILVAAGSVFLVPWISWEDRWRFHFDFFPFSLIYFLPCFFFGLTFGQLIARSASNWGRDVGRFSAMNTFGSCLGIIAFALLGYEMEHAWNAWLISLGLLFTLFFLLAGARRRLGLGLPWWLQTGIVGAPCGIVLLVIVGLLKPYTDHSNGVRSFYGRDGVVEIHDGTEMIWDGLWHSSLSKDGDHIGSRNWLLAVLPVLCHQEGRPRDVLVVGLGTGITAATLATKDSVRSVDVYDINQTLKPILRRYPEGTLHVLDNPKVTIHWQDGRSGLALHPKQYDLITQQPLYLKQAGSSILLSQEYFELVRSRLKPGGVFAVYSNSMGYESQALLVRQTLRSVFPHCVSFMKGYALVASESPIEIDTIRENLRTVREEEDEFASEVRRLKEGCAAETSPSSCLLGLFDRDRLSWEGSSYLIRDDHPLVEYPHVAEKLIPRHR